MCLSKVTKVEVLKEDLIVKKLVVCKLSGKGIVYTGLVYSFPEKNKNGYYIDKKKDFIFTTDIKNEISVKYKTGFHFHSKSAPNRKIEQFWGVRTAEKIVKCLIPKGTRVTIGYQETVFKGAIYYMKLKTIVARKFKIREE